MPLGIVRPQLQRPPVTVQLESEQNNCPSEAWIMVLSMSCQHACNKAVQPSACTGARSHRLTPALGVTSRHSHCAHYSVAPLT